MNRQQQETHLRPAHLASQTRLKDMDRAGIDIQAISPAPGQYYYWAEPGLARQTARLINEHIAEIVTPSIPTASSASAPCRCRRRSSPSRELERAVKELGLRGVEIYTNVAGEELSAERFRPFFAKAQELDVLIFLHPSGFTEGRRLGAALLHQRHRQSARSRRWRCSHLIFGGVLAAYPRLKICVAHGGGFLAAYSGRIDHAHAARSDCRLVIKRKPTSYLKKLYFDTIVFTHHQLEYLAQPLWQRSHLAGHRLSLRHGRCPIAVRFVESAPGLSRADQAAILGGNAARLLKIQHSPAPAQAGRQTKAKRPGAHSTSIASALSG